MSDIDTKSVHNRDVEPHSPVVQQDSQPAFPIYHRRIGNPAPLGVLSFAAPTFILSMFNIQADGITVGNLVVGMALIVGGLTQLLAGMWEFICGNTFGGTVFTLFSGFWMSYGLIFLPFVGIMDAYTATPEAAAQLHNALGIYLMTWFLLIFIMIFATLRSSFALCFLIILVDITILVLGVAEFTQSVAITKAGGGLGIASALLAFYVGAATLYTQENSYIRLPTGELPKYKV